MSSQSSIWLRRSRPCLVGIAVWLGVPGCLGEEESVERGARQLTDGEDEEQEDECLATDVTWSPPTTTEDACTGPWTYTRHPILRGEHSACGESGRCRQHYRCLNWATPPTTQPNILTSTTTAERTFRGINCFTDPETGALVCDPDWTRGQAACAQFRRDEEARLELTASEVPPGTPLQRIVSGSVATDTLRYSLGAWTFRCTATIRYEKQTSNRHTACLCETPIYNTCNRADTSRTERIVTPSGQTKRWVFDSHDDSVVNQKTDQQINAQCATGEDEPDRVLKINRLFTNMGDPAIVPAGSAGAALRETMIRQIKATYELFDNNDVASAQARHTDVRNLYQQFPALARTCGRHKPATTASCNGDWQLRLCTRLTSAHVKVRAGYGDLVRHLYPLCLDQMRLLGDDIQNGACRADGDFAAATVDAQRRVQEKVLLRFGTRWDSAPTANNTPLLGDTLHQLDRWYVQAARISTGPAPLQAELELAANKFWQVGYGYVPRAEETEWVPDSTYADLEAKLRQAEAGPPGEAGQTIENALMDTETRGFKLDREVLTAAYGTVGALPAMTGVPLLRITTDALGPLADRVESLAQVHDVGCILAQCVTFTTPTKLSRFWKVLAHLTATPGASPDLGDVLAAAPGTMLGWKAAFTAVDGQQQRLFDAIAAAREANHPSEDELRALVERARARSASYQATGMFLPAVGNRLHTGVHDAQRDLVIARLSALRGEIATTKQWIEDHLLSLVNSLVAVREGETSLEQLQATKTRIEVERDDLKKRAEEFAKLIPGGIPGTTCPTGACPAGETEMDVFTQLMAEWSLREGAIDEQDYLRVGDTIRLPPLTGQHANFVGWEDKTIADVGVQKIEVGEGEHTLSIETSGRWAPSCALRSARVIDPDDIDPDLPGREGRRINRTEVPVGPEGYSMSWTGSSFEAESSHESTSMRATAGARLEACAGTPGFGLGGGVRACTYVDISASLESSTGEQAGDESRTSAQFASGIFLPTTPFEAPAGALVLVEMPPGETDPSRRRDVHLVYAPHTTIALDEPADLWVVVNDLHHSADPDDDCTDQDGSNALTVTVRKMAGVGQYAGALIERMAHTVGLVRQHRPGLMARGEILPSEATAIELEAKLGQIGGPDQPQFAVDDYPVPMRDLFYKFLAREMTRLEAAVRIVAIQREIVIKDAEYKAATVAVENSRMSGYLLALLPKWNARGLRFKELREITALYVQDFRDHLVPVLRLWYPDALDLGNPSSLQALTTVDIDTPALTITEWLIQIGTLLENKIRSAELPYPTSDDTATDFVVLRFPHPSELDSVCADSPSARCRRRGHNQTFRWATTAQSRALWAQLGQPGDGGTVRRLVFQPSPDDLYQAISGRHYLSCTKSLPVLRKIGLAFTGYSSTGMPSDPPRAEGRIPDTASMTFVDSLGVHDFRMTDSAWHGLARVPIVYGLNNLDQVRIDFNAMSQDVRGVTPFTKFVFTIDELDVAEGQLRDAKAIDLVMELEAIRAEGVVAIPGCTAAALAAE